MGNRESRQTVLVVDDDPNIAKLTRLYLERDGYRVVTASDGAVGLALARQEMPSLIVLDLMLPRLNGLDVCRTLRQESDVPIIMLTARVEEEDRLTGLGLGSGRLCYQAVQSPRAGGEGTGRAPPRQSATGTMTGPQRCRQAPWSWTCEGAGPWWAGRVAAYANGVPPAWLS